ncbi:MAG: hypothetical protein F4103_03460 [Boseongicola sp. SB0673_bin_14]|nr:hypothetical protein [Boseongicola sp. SB0673_bin_14]
MTEPYRPNIRWLFDWGNDGQFDHPLSDVSGDVLIYNLRWGTAADTPQIAKVTPDSEDVQIVGGILPDTAQGAIQIYDRDGRFDPDNPGLQVSESILRSPIGVRLLHNSRILWQGIGLPNYGVAVRPTTFFEWQLQGKFYGEAAGRLDLISSPGSLHNIEDDEVSLTLTSTRDLPLGLVRFNGARIKMYELIGRMIGGWVYENERGDFRLITMQDAFAASAPNMLDPSFEPYDGAIIKELTSLVTTRATYTSQAWSPVVDTQTKQLREVSVGTEQYRLFAGATTFTWRMRPGDPRRIDTWLEPQVIGDARIIVRSSSTRDRSITFTVLAASSGDYSVSLRAHISEIATVAERDYINESVEAVYGKRDLGLPPWYSANLVDAEAITGAWLDNLSEPLEWFRITYPEWQTSVAKHQQLLDTKPGSVSNFVVSTQQKALRPVKGLVLAVRLQGGHRQIPTRTVYGVGVRIRPPVPLLAASATVLSPYRIQANVRLEQSDPSKTIYVDIEKET